jgi:hypothetical protein
VKRLSDFNPVTEKTLLGLSVYEFYFHIEAIKAGKSK